MNNPRGRLKCSPLLAGYSAGYASGLDGEIRASRGVDCERPGRDDDDDDCRETTRM